MILTSHSVGDVMDRLNRSKRNFLKTIAYVAPVIATFQVAPAFAAVGSNVDQKPVGDHKPNRRPHRSTGSKRHDNKRKFYVRKKQYARKQRHSN